jgi:hypothetical protein
MADLLTINVDTAALIDALTKYSAFAGRHLKDAAFITATAIRREARARVARATGETAQGITVEETHNKEGYVVFPYRPDNPGLPGWIESGTEKMKARPFLMNSARLEEGAHMRRVREALDFAAEDAGLGD